MCRGLAIDAWATTGGGRKLESRKKITAPDQTSHPAARQPNTQQLQPVYCKNHQCLPFPSSQTATKRKKCFVLPPKFSCHSLPMATKRKLATVAKPVQHGSKQPKSARIDESRTAVSVPDQLHATSSKGIETIEISSDSESNYSDLSDLDDEDDNQTTLRAESAQNTHSKANGQNGDNQMKDGDDEDDDEDDQDAEPTFGDRIRNETIDVHATQSSTKNSLPPRQLATPSAASLGTVLAQALRTDDADLLESCLQISETTVIRNTIQRLDSSLAGALLTQIASRMHRRPGRAHNLMSFVQWTLIAHGGALATQPDIQRRVAELNRVLEERSRGLNSLLALKGKLDMLEAQMTLRRGNKSRRGATDGDSDEEESDGEEGVVYVEGQEDEVLANGSSRRKDDDDDDLPITNGVASDSEEDSDDEDQDEIDVDDFAEESVDEDDVDHDDVEDDSAEEEDESEAEPAPPTKVQKKSKSSFSRR